MVTKHIKKWWKQSISGDIMSLRQFARTWAKKDHPFLQLEAIRWMNEKNMGEKDENRLYLEKMHAASKEFNPS